VEKSGGPKLAAVAFFSTTVYIASEKGKNVAFENNINQGNLFHEVDEQTGEVKEMRRSV